MCILTACLWSVSLSLRWDELGFMTDCYFIIDLMVPNSGWFSLLSWPLRKVFPPWEKWILIQPVFTGHLLAGPLLGVGQMDVRKVQQCFCPRGAYHLVLSVVPRPVKSASSGDHHVRNGNSQAPPRPTESQAHVWKSLLHAKMTLIKHQNI